MWTFHDDLQAIHRGEDPSGNRPALMRIMAHATLFEIRNDPAATYIAQAPLSRPIPKDKVIYHTNHPPSYIEKGYHLHIPKAPTTLLEETLEIFRAVPDIEAHVNIVHRTADASYRLISTQAEASRGHVRYEPLTHTPEEFVVAEIHSHHTMSAYFSATDNSSEIRSGFYGVVGRIHLDRPEAAFRSSCGGVFKQVTANRLFEPTRRITELVKEVRPVWPEPNRFV